MGRPPADVAATIGALPDAPGVYRFRDARGDVLYIGRAARLRRRTRSYWGDLRDRPRLRPMVARVVEVEAVVCRSEHEAAWLERNLLARRKPRANRVVGGAESEVYLRLGEHGLQLAHERPADFGPFLGGEQTRLAIAGIHRAVPLRYARPRTGSEREMAQARGAFDAEAMHTLVRAALTGDLDAVTTIAAALERARDEQAAALRFERAAALQTQLSAFRWVTAEQRVAGVTPTEFDAAGWSDGVLVRFAFRDGRLCEWHRTRCTAAAAQALLDATPRRWRPFADANATLAAHLLRAGSGPSRTGPEPVTAPGSSGTST